MPIRPRRPARIVPARNGGGSHPDRPARKPTPEGISNIPPIVDVYEREPTQTDLTRRSVINRASRPVPIELRGTVAGRRSPVALLLGKFRTPGKPLYWKHQPNLGWIWTLGFGEPINQPTKVNVNGKDYTFTSQGNGRYFANIDGGTLHVYDGTQDYVDFRLQQIASVNYDESHETHCYGVLVLNTPSDWPSVWLVGEGANNVRISGASDTRGYTTNPAWLVAYLLEQFTEDVSIDWPTVQTAADYCDETPGTGKRSEIGLALHRPESIDTWTAILREYAYCYMLNNGDSVRFVTDKARTSTENWGNNEIVLEGTSWTKGDLNATPENVVVQWFDSDTGTTDEAYAIDAGFDLEDSYNMKGFLSYEQAQLYATRRYNKMTLRDLSGTVTVSGIGAKADFGDVVTVSDARYGAIQSKEVEVLEVASRELGEFVCRVIEYQNNTYTDSPQSEPDSPDTTLPDPSEITPRTPIATVLDTGQSRQIQAVCSKSGHNVIGADFQGETDTDINFGSPTTFFFPSTVITDGQASIPLIYIDTVGGSDTYFRLRAKAVDEYGNRSEWSDWSDTYTF